MIKVVTQSTMERNNEVNEKYQEFKELFYNTELRIPEIHKQLDLSKNSHIIKDIKHRWIKENETDPHLRGIMIHHGKWLK